MTSADGTVRISSYTVLAAAAEPERTVAFFNHCREPPVSSADYRLVGAIAVGASMLVSGDDFKVSGDRKGSLKVWDVGAGLSCPGSATEPVCTMGLKSPVTCLACSPVDASTFASGDASGTVTVWQIHSAGKAIAVKCMFDGFNLARERNSGLGIADLAFHPSGDRLLVASTGKKLVRMFDLSRRKKAFLAGHPRAATCCRYVHAGLALTGCEDGKTRLWLPKSGIHVVSQFEGGSSQDKKEVSCAAMQLETLLFLYRMMPPSGLIRAFNPAARHRNFGQWMLGWEAAAHSSRFIYSGVMMFTSRSRFYIVGFVLVPLLLLRAAASGVFFFSPALRVAVRALEQFCKQAFTGI